MKKGRFECLKKAHLPFRFEEGLKTSRTILGILNFHLVGGAGGFGA
jgi:hypothetical protein